jgi:hypothetical protein
MSENTLSSRQQKMVDDAAKAMGDIMNCMGNEKMTAELIYKLVAGQHRTLQQNFFRFIVQCIRQFAVSYDRGAYDARNEESCRLSKEIISKFDINYIPFI